LWVAIGCAGTRFSARQYYIMRAAMALASRAFDRRGGGKIANFDRDPRKAVKSHFLAIHQPNLAENMI
jgi:hypothetical protein